MKPTPEQVEAAKAWTRSSPSSPINAEQYAALEAYVDANKGTPGLWQWSDAPAFILLAALEAAEADSARLDWLEERKYCLMAMAESLPEKPEDWWSLMTDRHDHEASTARDAIDAARKAQP